MLFRSPILICSYFCTRRGPATWSYILPSCPHILFLFVDSVVCFDVPGSCPQPLLAPFAPNSCSHLLRPPLAPTSCPEFTYRGTYNSDCQGSHARVIGSRFVEAVLCFFSIVCFPSRDWVHEKRVFDMCVFGPAGLSKVRIF